MTFVVGLAVLTGGARCLVHGAVRLAKVLRVSQLMIGLTIVAIGTSLPELATSVTATIRRQADISVGNILGSNVFNILFVMGLCAQIKPLPVRPESLQVDLPVMLVSVVLMGVLVMRGQRLGRVGGALLLIGYGAYLWNKAV